MNSDTNVTLQSLKETIKKFGAKRNWETFHTPKNAAINISVEANELLELFTWLSDKKVTEQLKNPDFLQCVKDELADVFHAAILLANVLELDIHEIVQKKLLKTGEKYPIKESSNSLDIYLADKTKKTKHL